MFVVSQINDIFKQLIYNAIVKSANIPIPLQNM